MYILLFTFAVNMVLNLSVAGQANNSKLLASICGLH